MRGCCTGILAAKQFPRFTHTEMTSISRHFAELAVLILAIGVAQASPHVRTESTIAADNVVLSLRSTLKSTPPPPRVVFDLDPGDSDSKKPENNKAPASQRFKKSDSTQWDQG
jgi:hypothetical protein